MEKLKDKKTLGRKMYAIPHELLHHVSINIFKLCEVCLEEGG